MKMAKASQQDLDAANQVASYLSDLEKGFLPTVPGDEGASELFDRTDPDDCMRALNAILDAAEAGSVFRVTFGMQVVCDPRNKVIDPDADTLEIHPEHVANAEKADTLTARVAELEAHLRTIAKFGGTLDQARELAAKGIERAAQVAKGPKCET